MYENKYWVYVIMIFDRCEPTGNRIGQTMAACKIASTESSSSRRLQIAAKQQQQTAEQINSAKRERRKGYTGSRRVYSSKGGLRTEAEPKEPHQVRTGAEQNSHSIRRAEGE